MISVIIPFHNEEENIIPLYEELRMMFDSHGYAHEILFIDDGSTDKSSEQVKQVIEKDHHVFLHIHKKQFGKGKALQTGLSHSKGDIIIFMDGDLQDDPKEIPAFMEKLHEGYDLVNGIRTKRKDNSVVKIYSRVANFVLHRLLRSPFTDINCGFKIFKKEIIKDIPFYGNNFRFFPLAAYLEGHKVSEIHVRNRERVHGKTKYGIFKLIIGILDMVTAYFLFRFAERPLHFFGVIGGTFFTIGFLLSLYLSIERIFFNVLLYRRPALLFGILMIIVGIQIGMTGIMGELIVYLNKQKNNSKDVH